MSSEKHLSADVLAADRRKRRKRKKGILIALIIIMVAAGAAEVFVLKSMTSVDRRFIRGVERGVASGWETGSGELQLRDSGKIVNTDFIDTELEAVREFKSKPYDDKELKELSRRYISALEKCREAAASHDPSADSEEFWKNFSAAYTDRLIVLKSLYNGDYKMGDSWDDYPEQRDEMLSRAWVAETLPNLTFKRTESENGIDRFTAVLKNNSGFDIDYISIGIIIYNKKGEKTGTAEVYKEKIPNESDASLVFYYNSDKIAYYKISKADCRISQNQ